MARSYRLTVTQRKDGLWQGAYQKNGKRKYVYSRDRDTALEKLRVARSAPPPPPPSPDVSMLLSGWIRAVAPSLGPQTLVSYENIVRRHLVPALGHIRIEALTEDHVEDYMEAKLESGLSPRTVQYHHRVLSLALGRAEGRKKVALNVARFVKPPAPQPPDIEPLSRDEVAKLLAGTTGEDHNLYAVAIYTGLRLGELLALRWDRVDLDKGTLTVSQALGRIRGRSAILPPKSKTSRRTIPVPRPALEALVDQKAIGTSSELVFADPEGKLLVPSTVGNRFQRHLGRLAIRERRFHDLRHTCATLMLATGGSLHDVKQFLGHSSIKLTSDTYGHLDPGRQRDVADLLGNAVELER